MAFSDLLWSCMAFYGIIWPYIVFIVFYGILWPFYGNHGNILIWTCMAFSRGHTVDPNSFALVLPCRELKIRVVLRLRHFDDS